MHNVARRRAAAAVLLVLAALLVLFTLLAAFTIYGEIAGVLALACLAAGVVLLSRR